MTEEKLDWSDTRIFVYGVMHVAGGYSVASGWHGWTMFWGFAILALITTTGNERTTNGQTKNNR